MGMDSDDEIPKDFSSLLKRSSIQRGGGVGCDFRLSFTLFFSFPERLHCCYIYIFAAPTCTAAVVPLEPCALNAEF
jgi:hypothetical protein